MGECVCGCGCGCGCGCVTKPGLKLMIADGIGRELGVCGGVAAGGAARRAAEEEEEEKVEDLGAVTAEEARSIVEAERRRWRTMLPRRCSVYLPYWYKRTHTDAAAAASCPPPPPPFLALPGRMRRRPWRTRRTTKPRKKKKKKICAWTRQSRICARKASWSRRTCRCWRRGVLRSRAAPRVPGSCNTRIRQLQQHTCRCWRRGMRLPAGAVAPASACTTAGTHFTHFTHFTCLA